MHDTSSPRPFYPAFLDLRGRLVVVIGGGEVALRKVEALLAADATVRVVAPEIDPRIMELVQQGRVEVRRRPYERGDLKGAMLAVAATSTEAANRAVAADAREGNLFVNVVDVPDLCSFIVPSVIRRGELSVAISTGGLSPALAKRIRIRLEEQFPQEYGSFLQLLGKLRPRIRESFPLPEQRERFWSEAMGSSLFELYCAEGEAAANQRLEEIILRLQQG